MLVFLSTVQGDLPQSELIKSTGPPAFFLQDPSDGLCLSGSKLKRCAIDTLWYVSGKPGFYQIHHRIVDEETEFDTCLSKADCHLDASALQVGSCNHCGSKKWNILGDADTGARYAVGLHVSPS